MAHWIKHVRLNLILQNKIALITGIVIVREELILAAEYVALLKSHVSNLKQIKVKKWIKVGLRPNTMLMSKAILIE